MNLSKINEIIDNLIQGSTYGMIGIDDLNRDKAGIFKCLLNNMQKRTLGMFEYKGLPETLSPRSIERYLQGTGTCLIIKATREMIGNPEALPGFYALPCKAGGRVNADYLPTFAVVQNSWLQLKKENFDLRPGHEEAVYCWNDSLLEGLAPLFSLYASELTDNIQTLHFQEIHNRILTIIKANDDDEKKDAIDFFKSYEDGKFASLLNSDFIDSLKNNRVDPFKGASNTSIKDTLEARQWLLAHWNIEIGLNDNYNMKREAINENEIEANSDTLTPLLDDMEKCRKITLIEACKRLWPDDFKEASVEFGSSWKRVDRREKNAQKEEDLQIDILEKEAEAPNEPVEESAGDKAQESEEPKE